MTDAMYKELEDTLIESGYEAIVDFLGTPIKATAEAELRALINDEFDQMPEDIVEDYYNQFCGK